MDEISLKVELREKLKAGNPKRILKEGNLPAVVYGAGLENVNLKVNYQEFLKVFELAGESKVVDLIFKDKTIKVFIHQIQRDPVSNKIIHVDFYQFNKDHKFHVDIPIHFIGESKAVKEAGGVLVTNIDSVLVECLYDDLISELEVDLSNLENLNDSIYVSDLKLNPGVNILTSQDQVIVSVKPMRAKEEIKEEENKEEKIEQGEDNSNEKSDNSEAEKAKKSDSEKQE